MDGLDMPLGFLVALPVDRATVDLDADNLDLIRRILAPTLMQRDVRMSVRRPGLITVAKIARQFRFCRNRSVGSNSTEQRSRSSSGENVSA